MILLFLLVSIIKGLCAAGASDFMSDPLKLPPPDASAPVAEEPRTKKPLCDAWTFHLGEVAGLEKADFDDAKWRTLDVPHDWSIELSLDPKFPNGGAVGYLSGGLGWYRKTFTISEASRGRKVFVDFDGVNMGSTVWINGQLLGGRPYGCTSFQFELTPYLNFGGEKNVLAVRVKAVPSTRRWYPRAGIYRRVWLTTVNPVHISHWGTFVTTPEISKSQSAARYVDKEYAIPAELIQGKSVITVRFQAEPNSTAGGVFRIRVLTAAPTASKELPH